MAKFVIYEIWSRARVVESASIETVFDEHEPDAAMHSEHGLSLGNWHAVPVADATPVTEFKGE